MDMQWWKPVLRVALILFVTLMVVVAVAGFFLPSSLEVEESVVVHAPPHVIYDRAIDLKRWEDWGPWWQREPFLETDFSGPERGKGALMRWSSRRQGEGQLKITGAAPNREILLALDFGERGGSEAVLTLTPRAGYEQTEARWKFRAEFGDNTGRRWAGLLMRNYVRTELAIALLALKTACEEEYSKTAQSNLSSEEAQPGPSAGN